MPPTPTITVPATLTRTPTITPTITPPPTQTFGPSNVDYYKCYGAKDAKFKVLHDATLTDNFINGSTSADVRRPTLICDPVEADVNTGTPGPTPKNKRNLLVCYQIREKVPAHKPQNQTVQLEPAFAGSMETVDAGYPKLLCVPAVRYGP